MTDTGQIPGEGLPENAGMVQQPGVTAPAAYTYLEPSDTSDASETAVEDEDQLLMPGQQGAWGNEMAPPAPAHHEPGAHETGGRDSGSVDLSAVRTPSAPGAHAGPGRRPLHLGPPIPTPTASPVRSLADRGPAAAPLRPTGGPATIGPEYLDVTQEQESAPQGAAPWGATPQAGPGAVPAEAATAPHAAATGLGTAVAEPGTGYGALPEPPQSPRTPATPETPPPSAVVAEGAYGQFPQAAGADGSPQLQEPVAATGQPAGHGPESPAAAVPEAAAAQAGPAAEVVTAQGGPVEGPQVPAPEGQPQAPEPSAPVAVPVPDAPGLPQAAVPAPEAGAPDAPGSPAPQRAVPADGTAGPVADGALTPQGEAHVVPADPNSYEQPVTAPGAPEAGQPAPEAATVEPPVAVADDARRSGTDAAPAPEPVPYAADQPQPVHPGVPDASVAAPEPQAPAVAPVGPQTPVAPEEAYAVAVPEAPEAAVAPAQPDPAARFAGPGDATGLPENADAHAAAAPQTAVDAGAASVTEDVVTAEPGVPVVATEAPTADAPNDPEPGAADEVPAADVPATPPTEPADAVAEPGTAAPAAPLVAAPLAPVDPAAGPEAPGVADGPVDPHTEGSADQPAGEAPDRPFPQVTEPPAEPSVPAEDLAPLTPHPSPVPAQGSADRTPDATPEPPTAAGAVPAPSGPQDPQAAEAPAPVTVPAPREGGAPTAAGAPAQPESAEGPEATGTPEPVEPAGPAAPGYDEAEREAVLRVMRERRDIRNGFRSDPIPHEVLRRVLEAAHTAPSVGHSQPWDFVVIRSEDTRRAMHELAMRQRDAYAKSLPKGRAKQFKELKIEAILETPVNIVVTADPTRGGRHTLGRHTQPQMAPYSSALAVENLWLAARAEGLGVGWVSFFDEREMVRALGLPDHLEVVAYLCVGYVDEFPPEPELLQAGWSKRRPLSWVVHEETYGRRALPGEEPHDLLAETMAGIRPLDAKALGEAWDRQKRMTKPSGALGMLEIISAQLSGLSRKCPPPIPEPAAVAIFAGDHGVHAQGVTPWPQEVTAQMVANFLGGGAVCNAFAAQVGAEVCVIDVGVASDLPATPGLLPRKVRPGTADMTAGPALTREEVKQAIEIGIETARDLVAAGNKALLTGEMGIANTTASAALISVFTGADPAEVTGRGTGINDETLARKTEVVRRAIELHQPDPADPIGVLAAFGGLEHAAMVGLLLGGASLRTPVILDGVSAGAAALVARAIAPEVLAACIAGHRSAEPGHVAALNKLGLRPLVDLDLRLGEGTGALLALPLVQSAARAMHEVATFDSAGVTEK
ncbi:nicotinate-nucleotide--dimethylbenzimidazole phosphoribosyltransferase [Streptomyces sp. B3I8]|uniref:nicotinate-nucleotide--dimethylbenzimidazole phosphoribosyltransferase n=1 Tax=Streptomyces sp. B3I8 TaxID=3042303 RepID=UPI00277E622C|nr:nicotinate-nucleotide--dimethylbenzimidazole phosphoribosyltransferase [Streptomyces sp. B3I8]MDQ0785965.1 nicotinate-nucleotide--dimethylbenzimidazole phosphoribosyltransferase [Streptomyces sp. B3I8]